jgi:hypothetical protein
MSLPGGAAPIALGVSLPLILVAVWLRSPSTGLREKILKSTVVPIAQVETPNVRRLLFGLAVPAHDEVTLDARMRDCPQ